MTDWLERHQRRILGIDQKAQAEQNCLWEQDEKGGPGSGNWGHVGRPGFVGGSAPRGGAGGGGTSKPAESGETVKPGSKIDIQVSTWGGVESKPVKVLASRDGMVVHRAVLKRGLPSKDQDPGYNLSHINTGIGLFPRAFRSRRAASRAMNVMAESGLDWNVLGDKNIEVLKEYFYAHPDDFE